MVVQDKLDDLTILPHIKVTASACIWSRIKFC